MIYPEAVGARLMHQPIKKVQKILERTKPSTVVNHFKVKSGVPEEVIGIEKVLDAMHKLGKPAGRKDIADYLYCSETRVTYIIACLLKSGTIVRDGQGGFPFRYVVAK